MSSSAATTSSGDKKGRVLLAYSGGLGEYTLLTTVYTELFEADV